MFFQKTVGRVSRGYYDHVLVVNFLTWRLLRFHAAKDGPEVGFDGEFPEFDAILVNVEGVQKLYSSVLHRPFLAS
jgi:hypothetical protein